MTTNSEPSLDAFARQVADLADGLIARIHAATDTAALNDLRVEALGKKGSLTAMLRSMGQLPPAERPGAGQLVNAAKERVAQALDSRINDVAALELEARLRAEQIDITLPGTAPTRGYLHPLRRTLDEMLEILGSMGFTPMDGPEIEDDFHCFEALNFLPDHPARDMQDTFYMPGGLLLRTHTSPVQIRTMLKHQPPIAVSCPGKVYRVDSDVSHSPMFTQMEGLLVDEKTTFADLKGTLQYLIERLFGEGLKTRFRPSFFPFVEPGAEVDMTCLFCKGKGCRTCGNSGWIEILGAGMVHKNVLRNCGIDPEKYQGFAFGIGVDRVAMLKYGIHDIRFLFENDTRLLRRD